MTTTATATALNASCVLPIDLSATTGELCVEDNGDGSAGFMVVTLRLEDVPDTVCTLDLGLLGTQNITISISNFVIANGGPDFEVQIPSAGGAMTGNQVVQATGTLTADGADSPLDFPGSLPEGDVAYAAGTSASATYADGNYKMLDQDIMTEVMGFPVTVNFTLTGLNGTVSFEK